MEIKFLQVLVMPNDEVLYLGRTLGFVSADEKGSKVILAKHLISEDKIIKE